MCGGHTGSTLKSGGRCCQLWGSLRGRGPGYSWGVGVTMPGCVSVISRFAGANSHADRDRDHDHPHNGVYPSARRQPNWGAAAQDVR
jgi:hypothetical protein